jgi:myosin heavy subunit
MLLRILLIVTILIGIGAIAVSQFVVRPHVQTIIDARNKNLQDYQSEQGAHRKTKSTLKETQGKLVETEKNLDETKTQLTAANTKASDQERRANGLDTELGKTKQTLAGVQADLAAWSALGIPVDQVKNVIAEAKKLRAANEAIEEEKKILAASLKKATDKLLVYEGNEEQEPMLPAGLRGKVLVVDPKFNFVVLDIGANKGVENRGVLMISRNAKLVAKVKVMSVQPERSIANIMPDWKLDTVMEGDQVLYYR